jgi:hypothetical protein
MHAELDKDEDRGTVLARFVSELSTEDEQMLRALLDGGADSGAEGADRGGTGR